MQAINIVPREYLQLTTDADFHMSLYQEIMKKDEYAFFYREVRKAGKFVIMDNGAAEKVNPSWEELLHGYDTTNPTEIILPDVVGNKDETLRRTSAAYDAFCQKDLHEKYQFMCVPQGSTFQEWLDCMDEMMTQECVTTLGVSKFVTKLLSEELQNVNIRLECVDAIKQTAKRHGIVCPQIHLLGCYYTPYEVGEIEAAFPGVVRSTDSAIAYVYSRNGLYLDQEERPDQNEINFSGDEIVPSRDGKMSALELLRYNMQKYADLCNNL